MKKLILLLCAFAVVQTCSAQEALLKLEPTESMCIYGKGPGQDAAINPYDGEDCQAVVKNVGKATVGVRVQYQGKIVELIDVAPREEKVVDLPKGYVIFFDCDKATKATIAFRQEEEKG